MSRLTLSFVCSNTVQKDGLRGLMKGAALRLLRRVTYAFSTNVNVSGNLIDVLRSVPMTGLSFLFYGITKTVPTLHCRHRRRHHCPSPPPSHMNAFPSPL